MKPIQLNEEQIKVLLNGASMLVMPIDNNRISIMIDNEHDTLSSAYKFQCNYCKGKDPKCTDCYGNGYIWDIDCESKEEFILKYSPLQTGEKYFVQEDFIVKFKCIDVEIKRVQDIQVNDILSIQTEMWTFNKWLEKQGINYKENPYIFLAKVEVIQ